MSIVVGNQAIPFKGAPGEAIVYPSTTLHEVVPVRSGQRLVSITFIESYIIDQHQRMQVYELNEIAALEGNAMSLGEPRAPGRRAAESHEDVVDDVIRAAAFIASAMLRSAFARFSSHVSPLRISSRLM